MTKDGRPTAAQLKEIFDSSFARAVAHSQPSREDLLRIRAGSSHMAVRVRDIAGLMPCPPLTSLPSRSQALRGLAAVRGTLVAVYGIAALIGGDGLAPANGRIVVCASDRSVALLFDELLGYERVDTDQIRSGRSDPDGPMKNLVHIRGTGHALLDIPGLLRVIDRIAESGPHEE